MNQTEILSMEEKKAADNTQDSLSSTASGGITHYIRTLTVDLCIPNNKTEMIC